MLLEPVDYASLVWLLDRAELVLTDSGGIQEEAPALGKPVLVLRDVTERPELIEAGAGFLVGTNPERIVREAGRLLDDPAWRASVGRPGALFGDGRAAMRIAARLAGEAVRDWVPSPEAPQRAGNATRGRPMSPPARRRLWLLLPAYEEEENLPPSSRTPATRSRRGREPPTGASSSSTTGAGTARRARRPPSRARASRCSPTGSTAGSGPR